MSQTLTIGPVQPSSSWDQVPDPASIGSLRVEVVNPLSPQWDREELSHPAANVFHLSAWAKVLTTTYGHRPFYLRFSRQDKLAGLVPIMEVHSRFTGKRGVSLPFSDFCSPLIFGDAVGMLPLLEEIIRIASTRKWKYFETRSNILAGDLAFPSEQFYGHELDLTSGGDSLFAAMAAPARRAVRKAEKSGLEVEISQTLEAMFDFYRLHSQTRRRHGVPPQSLAFFANLHREIVEPGHGFVALARLKQEPVAAAVFFHAGRQALYKYGASSLKLQSYRANNLVMWKAIEHLCRLGLSRLLFGRTELGNEGLRQFKRSWGVTEYELKYFKYEQSTRPVIGGSRARGHALYNRVFQNLPLSVNEIVGKAVYPHLD